MNTSQQKVSIPSGDAKRPALLLADGTPMASLVDRVRREVSPRVLSDAGVYQLELERIWARTWVVVGHESEIPNPGDFVTRRVGDDAVILVRGREGQINCLLNVCPHRGSVVCRAEAGNGPAFRCIYHGWIFNLDGSFRGLPFKDEIYSEGFDESRSGLPRARVGLFAGIIFVNWDETAPPLDEFLGEFRFYLNLMFNRPNRGLEVLGPPQRFIVDANWKTASEQFGGDAHHVVALHRYLGTALGANLSNPRVAQMHAPKVSMANGHNIMCLDLGDMYRGISGGRELSVMEKLTMMPPPGVPRSLLPEIVQRFSETELHLLANTPPSIGGMFPNVGLWNTVYNPLPDGSPAPFISFRTYVPLGVDKFEFSMWVLVARDADEEYRELTRRITSFTQGACGFIEGDDGEVWPGLTTTSRGYIARQRSTLKYWALAGDHPPAGWPGGGQVHTPFAKDDTQWNWWSHYFDVMTGKA